jgi:hypothetical protein
MSPAPDGWVSIPLTIEPPVDAYQVARLIETFLSLSDPPPPVSLNFMEGWIATSAAIAVEDFTTLMASYVYDPTQAWAFWKQTLWTLISSEHDGTVLTDEQVAQANAGMREWLYHQLLPD